MSIKICVPESKAGMFELRLRQRLKRIKRKIFSGLGHAVSIFALKKRKVAALEIFSEL